MKKSEIVMPAVLLVGAIIGDAFSTMHCTSIHGLAKWTRLWEKKTTFINKSPRKSSLSCASNAPHLQLLT